MRLIRLYYRSLLAQINQACNFLFLDHAQHKTLQLKISSRTKFKLDISSRVPYHVSSSAEVHVWQRQEVLACQSITLDLSSLDSDALHWRVVRRQLVAASTICVLALVHETEYIQSWIQSLYVSHQSTSARRPRVLDMLYLGICLVISTQLLGEVELPTTNDIQVHAS